MDMRSSRRRATDGLRNRLMSARRAVLPALVLWLPACGEDPTTPSARPTRLAFITQPALADGAVPIDPPPQVAVLDQRGSRDATAAMPVTLALGPGDAHLRRHRGRRGILLGLQ
ncbi:MAG TPA: hypothetical protein VIL25_00040 [Vicinamibacterales bacterium]